MEKLVNMTNDRMNKLESEKAHVEADLDVKKEVVQQSSEQIKTMRNKMEESERELEIIRKSLQEKENTFTEENNKHSAVHHYIVLQNIYRIIYCNSCYFLPLY